jgi:hypothetical protein
MQAESGEKAQKMVTTIAAKVGLTIIRLQLKMVRQGLRISLA